jgi:nitrite reductase/ring-hydroxylating ferredoxin subunit
MTLTAPDSAAVTAHASRTDVLCSEPALRQAWYAVARAIDVGAAPVSVTLLATRVVLYRTVTGVVAAPDRCPHREAPLSAGTVADGCLVCPYHGWTFGDDGRCVRVPSAADHVPPPPRAHLSTFGCTERYGLVWLCLGDTSPDAPDGIPVIVHEDNLTGGYGAEVAALIADRAFTDLDGPVRRLAGPDVPAVPFSRPLEAWYLIGPEKIAAAARELAGY